MHHTNITTNGKLVSHSINLLSQDAFGWYFTGLVDGEGCFRMSPANPRLSQSWQVHFCITMRADELPHLSAIARRVGCGRIYLKKPPIRLSPGAPKTKATVSWNTSRIADHSNILLPHFERYPLQFKKARDFAIWKQAIPVINESICRSKKGLRRGERRMSRTEWDYIASLYEQLKRVREFDSSSVANTSVSDE
jgi:hypothetical protein